jgi:hypothetical protein
MRRALLLLLVPALLVAATATGLATSAAANPVVEPTADDPAPNHPPIDLRRDAGPAVPEPSAALLFAAGALVLRGAARRRA